MRVAYIISDLDYAEAFKWIAEELDNDLIEVEFFFLNSQPPELIETLESMGQRCTYVQISNASISLFRAAMILFSKLKQGKFDAVHCHLFKACLLGLTTAKLLGIPKRIYTRHHSTYHHQYQPWAVKYDRLINYLATDIIAISKNVEHLLKQKEGVNNNKLHCIEHGFDLLAFEIVDEKRVNSLKEKYKLPTDKKIIGVVARYIHWKGHHLIIPAIKELIEKGQKVHLVLANANGPDRISIQQQLTELDQTDYTEITFEKDLFALYKIFDIYLHVPIDRRIEAFGQTYIEALAAGVPSVFTLSGIAPEFIVDRHNALVIEPQKPFQIVKAVESLLEDEELVEQLSRNGKASVQDYDKHYMIEKLRQLYLDER